MKDNLERGRTPQMKGDEGFAALISSIIISAILLLAITSSGLASFYSRFNILDAELKERSEADADACADSAILQLADNSDPSGTILTLNSLDTCRIGQVSGISQKTFRIQATSSITAVTDLQIVVDSDTLAVISYQEIANY